MLREEIVLDGLFYGCLFLGVASHVCLKHEKLTLVHLLDVGSCISVLDYVRHRLQLLGRLCRQIYQSQVVAFVRDQERS